MNSTRLQEVIQTNHGASTWLKSSIRHAIGRDVLDSLRDAELLLWYCQMRAAEEGLHVAPQPPSTDIFDAVIKAMQPAEEMGGPEGKEYLNLMARIAREANNRIINWSTNSDARNLGEPDAQSKVMFAVGRDPHDERHHYTPQQMIEANAEDLDLLGWMDGAEVGDVYEEGGERVERIA